MLRKNSNVGKNHNYKSFSGVHHPNIHSLIEPSIIIEEEEKTAIPKIIITPADAVVANKSQKKKRRRRETSLPQKGLESPDMAQAMREMSS